MLFGELFSHKISIAHQELLVLMPPKAEPYIGAAKVIGFAIHILGHHTNELPPNLNRYP